MCMRDVAALSLQQSENVTNEAYGISLYYNYALKAMYMSHFLCLEAGLSHRPSCLEEAHVHTYT
jgi:hypothetical protein